MNKTRKEGKVVLWDDKCIGASSRVFQTHWQIYEKREQVKISIGRLMIAVK